jgi:lipid-binding SYLF domain-containing protein
MYSDLTEDDDIPFAEARITQLWRLIARHRSERAGIQILRKEFMKSRSMIGMVAVFCLAMAVGTITQAQAKKNLKDEVSQSEKAARVFREIMDTPDKGIPQELLENAECVAVFPSVIKAGFIFGGRGGRGVASCRTAAGWSAPAFFTLGGGSFGLQIGAQSTDFVMLFMNKDGLNSLLSDQFTLGGDASVAAGPVGRQAGASTDLKLNAQILSYSRSKGLFAGLELKGVVIKPDKDDMRDVYGEGITAKEVLKENKVTAPVAVRAFPITLGHFSSRVAKK